MDKVLVWWLVGGGDRSQMSHTAPNRQAPASFNSDQYGKQQMDIQDVVLDHIPTKSEVVVFRHYYVSINLVSSAA
jgi:hypothetical protein